MIDIITIDFETYYDKNYTLSKLTTEEYVRDSRFEVIGVSVQVNNETPTYHSGTKESTKKYLDQFNWGNVIALAHNAMFDMAILYWHFNISPKKIADTLSMGRAIHGTNVGGSLKALVSYYDLGVKGTEIENALGKRRVDFTPEQLERYMAYCCNDVEITFKLFSTMAVGFPISELNLIDITIRMFSEPVIEIDQNALQTYITKIQGDKQKILNSITDILGCDITDAKKNLMSNPKFAELLRQNGVTPPMKISPTTNKETYAFAKTDEGFKALLEHEKLEIQILANARVGTKSTIEETRAQRFIDISHRGKLPIPLKYYAAHTGRWGGSDKVNLQNLPSRGNTTLKEALLAPEGYVFIDADSSQIEARTLAWLAEQEDLVEAFENHEDVYKIMAGKIYTKNVIDISSSERFIGKMTVLGCGYSMGYVKFGAQLKASANVDLPEHELQHIINTYRESNYKITELWRTADKALYAIANNQYMEFGRGGILKVEGVKGIKLPNGLYINYPNLRKEEDESGRPQWVYDNRRSRKAVTVTKIYGGKVIENVTQALARIIIGEQMIKINKKYRPAMTVHDAVGIVVPIDDKDTAVAYVEKCMRERPSWCIELPLDCESGVGESYGGCK